MKMNTIDLAEQRIAHEVERLFRENPPRYGELCENPVTGGWYVGVLDPTAVEKRKAQRALAAREWHALHGPADAQPLPITACEIEDRKYTRSEQAALDFILSCYGYSVWVNDYGMTNHPNFEEFARGVTASEHAPGFVKNDAELRKRYPPHPLLGLNAGHCWSRPKKRRG
jgi:hypothetical protein